MPEISRFYGVVIRMYHSDHSPPQFHAHYGDAEATIDIRQLAVSTGKLPPRALGMVVEWAAMHQTELLEAGTEPRETNHWNGLSRSNRPS